MMLFSKMIRPARLLFVCLLLLSLFAELSAQGFTIERFKVDLYLHRDGSFSVEEKIQTNFTESRHGIRREIPYRYVPQKVVGELALNHHPGFSYTTPIDSIRVEGHEYLTERKSDNYSIRIGSGDRYVTGKVDYTIKYRVYGAINQFLSRDELYWNVNGNGWDVPADLVEITVHLPDNKQLSEHSYRLYTGFKGEKESAAVATLAPGTFTAHTTAPLKSFQGLTIVLALPKGYLKHEDPPLTVLAENFVAHSLLTEVDLQTDGTALVTETMDLELKNMVFELTRRLGTDIPSSWLTDHLQHESGRIKLESEGVEVFEGDDIKKRVGTVEENPGFDAIVLEYKAQPGRRIYRVKYRVWGAMDFAKGEGRFYFPWLKYNLGEPTVKSKLVVRWPQGMQLDMKRSQVLHSKEGVLQQEIAADSMVLSCDEMLKNDFTASLALVLHGEWSPIKLPMRLYSPDQYLEKYDLDIEVRTNGSVHFDHRIGLVNHSISDYYEAMIRDRNSLWYEDLDFASPNPQLFGYDGSYYMYEKNLGEFLSRQEGPVGTRYRFPIRQLDQKKEVQTIGYSYSLYGLIGEHPVGGQRLNCPIMESPNMPADSVSFRIRLPDNILLDSTKVIAFAQEVDRNEHRAIELKFSPGLIEGIVEPGLFEDEAVVLNLQFPEGAIGTDRELAFWMVVENHPILCLPVFVFVLMLILWLIFGRDKPVVKVVQYYPPEDITPTEAGFLIDNKLHNRDLLALIYYWGANGNLTITEIKTKRGKSDYRLKKLKDLPGTARKYEKTMFNALFLGRKSVTLSKLKNQYWIYMRQARVQVNAHAKQKKFFVPGTRGFGQILRVIGVILMGFGLLMVGYNYIFHSNLSLVNWGIPIGWGLSGVIMWIFGRIMPRHGTFGLKKYAELRGFMEFIKTAEKDRLRLLVDEDPAYFGLTLSYAIALGQANDWVDKFGPLLSEPPTYYKSTSPDDFSARTFNVMMTKHLSSMSKSFNSTPPSSGGGYSGGGSSYSGGYSGGSSSSYSSSGGSGFSSGGSSGGGYGGGGGSSW